MDKGGEKVVITVATGTIIKVIAILALCYLLFYVRDVVLVILTAIVLASAVEPGTRWFTARKIPRIPAVLLIYVTVAMIFAGTIYFFFIPLLNESSAFLQSLPEHSEALVEAELSESGIFGSISEGLSLPAIVGTVNSTLSNLSSGFLGTVNVIFGGALSFFLIVVLSFYLAVQKDGVGAFLGIVTPLQYERYTLDLWRRSKEKIGLWMQGQLLLSIIVTVLTFLGLSLLGVEQALLLAFVAGIFELIPIFGAFLAAAPAILLAFLDGGLSFALVVTGLYLIIQQFESQLIYPLVVKKVVGVPPIISIIALVIGAKLAGFLGIILSVPLAAVFMELLSDLEKKKAHELSQH